MIHGLQFLFRLGTNLLEDGNPSPGAAKPLTKTWSVVIFNYNVSLFIKTSTRKIGHFEFRKFGVFKSISDVLSILKKFIFMDILAPKVTVHDVKSGL